MADVIYPVRSGDNNEELRWSLRTLAANYPHGTVWIVGHKPSWVTNVHHIPGNRQRTPQANVYHNILAACTHPGTPDQFIVFNDDFYITAKTSHIPTLYRGPLARHVEQVRKNRTNTWWHLSLETTQDVLLTAGYTNPLSYELHTPMRVDKLAMAEVLEKYIDVTPDNPPQWRTLYGVVNKIGGSQGKDTKSYRNGPIPEPFHSTQDISWRFFRAWYRNRYPDPCRYEKG